MSLTSLIIKTSFMIGDKKRDKGLLKPENIEVVTDIAYGDDSKWQSFDLYRPKGFEGKLPLIINIHGGAWVYGDKEVYAPYCMNLSEAGFVVMNASYRLAPKFKFPSQVEDISAMLGWVQKYFLDYDIDEQNIFFIGDSAGAHLASIYMAFQTNPTYAGFFPTIKKQKLSPKALVLNCGVYDMFEEINRKDSFLPKLLKDLLGRKPTEEDLEKLSPLRAITKDFPSVFMMTSNQDFLNHQTYLMSKVFKEIGVSHKVVEYGDSKNSQGHVFHLDLRNPTGQDCREEEISFLKSLLQIKTKK